MAIGEGPFQAVSFARHHLVSSKISGSESVKYAVDIFRQPVQERTARVGDVVCYRPHPHQTGAGDTMSLGVLTWIQSESDVVSSGDDRICATLEFFTKKRLREMLEAGDVGNDEDMGDDFERAPDYTAWLSNCEGFYKESDILTVPSIEETRIHVRFASFNRYLDVDEQTCTYRVESCPLLSS